MLTGIEHQSIKRLPLLQQLLASSLHTGKIRQIHNQAADLLRLGTSSHQARLGLLAALWAAAEHNKVMARKHQQTCSLQPDAGAGARDQQPHDATFCNRTGREGPSVKPRRDGLLMPLLAGVS